MIHAYRPIILFGALVAIAGAIWYLEMQKPRRSESDTRTIAVTSLPQAEARGTPLPLMPAEDRSAILKAKERKYPPAKELSGIQGFINTMPFQLADQIGKSVILIDFWTYSCINCQRTIPYANAWYKKYKDQGLVIVGVHTPEFEFEKKYDNVASAVKRLGITYPVVLDSDYGTWTAYHNLYWPREFLIDIDGYIVHDHIGEGGYDETERAIQSALGERQHALHLKNVIDTSIASPASAIPMDASQVKSPEVYFGSARNTYLANGTKGAQGSQTLFLPGRMSPNMLYLDGVWDFKNEFAENTSDTARIVFTYQAKNVYMVARSSPGATIHITRDGKPLGLEAGSDVSRSGTAVIKDDRLYSLIQGSGYGQHAIEIEIKCQGLQAFTLTFG